jgi:3-phytase/alkaline phosphatase D
MPTLTFLGQSTFNSSKTFAGTTVGGLSGITYDAANDLYYAISDSRNNGNGPVRFYTLTIDVRGVSSNPPGAVSFTGVTTLKDVNNIPFAPNVSDTEGIALTSSGNVFISSEGIPGANSVQPFVNRFNLATGQQNLVEPIPAKFVASADPTFGIRENKGFESLTVTPDQKFLFTATEAALEQDGPAPTSQDATVSRILKFDLTTNLPGAEYVYKTDAANGVSEILAVDNDTLLVLERSVVQTVPSLKIYEVSLAGATDISGFDSIATVANIPYVQKTLVADLLSPAFSSSGFSLDNFEGMTFGPTLPDGRRSLILVSDNNFGQLEIFGNLTRIAAFALDTNPLVSDVTTTLPETEENLTLIGTNNIHSAGNDLNNIIAGNDGSNLLYGKAGDDILLGNGGNDFLVGGLGDDTLTGGAGADRFFRKYSTTGIDTITDFQVGEDLYFVSASGFGADLVKGGAIASEQFTLGTAATDANTRFIYNSTSGALFFDADGVGAIAQVQVATFSTGLAMTNADFFVFA